MWDMKLRADEKYKLPSKYLHEELDMKKWKNIPIPVFKAFETMEDTFLRVENLIIEL